jgi:hypothetical protein
MGDCNAKAEEEPGGDKHAEIDADGLDNDAREHDQAAEDYAQPAAKDIWYVSNDWEWHTTNQQP